MSAGAKQKKPYQTGIELERTVRVCYPAGEGELVFRTERDWHKNVEPIAASEDKNTWTFEVKADQPFLYFKPCLIRDGEFRWSVGPNKLLLMAEEGQRASFPFFFSSELGHFSKLIEFPSEILGRNHRLRVYLPPGYDENDLASHPVVYMQDGQNLFFPEEAFRGQDWGISETSETLRAMSAVEDFVIVGIYSGDRLRDYTNPGYIAYAISLAEEIVPETERLLRIENHRRFRIVWGSSLGGVVSFYTVWQHPQIFGTAACMSSTFSHKGNLIERVLSEPFRDVAFYLDSGWPGDNYEVTIAMAMALVSRGWIYGHNLLHLCFPHAEHDEKAWGLRLHLPLQFINGAVARASRAMAPVLGDVA
ncbi:MAG TPA: alpha/beta hydrolase-fold protein [Chthoniobacterales bacterium]|nr:alpha/beta hydrolase-fold protein [Chthoniobacterales bacterium]